MTCQKNTKRYASFRIVTCWLFSTWITLSDDYKIGPTHCYISIWIVSVSHRQCLHSSLLKQLDVSVWTGYGENGNKTKRRQPKVFRPILLNLEEGEAIGGRGGYHFKERWWVPTSPPYILFLYQHSFARNFRLQFSVGGCERPILGKGGRRGAGNVPGITGSSLGNLNLK